MKSDKTVIAYIQAVNLFGDETYTCVEIPPDSLEKLKSALNSKQPFVPGAFGKILLSGRGYAETTEISRLAKNHKIIHFNEGTQSLRQPNG